MTDNLKKTHVLIMIFAVVLGSTLSGCDWSARWDLKRAEKVLKRAEDLNAEFCGLDRAQNAYYKGQTALEEGMELARHRYINEARDKASEAKDWAEEAVYWAEFYNEQLEKEKESLGAYKD